MLYIFLCPLDSFYISLYPSLPTLVVLSVDLLEAKGVGIMVQAVAASAVAQCRSRSPSVVGEGKNEGPSPGGRGLELTYEERHANNMLPATD